MTRRSPLDALRSDRTVQAVVAIAALALLARLVFLGQRVAHQDEARVGYWIVRFLVEGKYEYRPIVHGPFLFVVNRYVFGLFGPSDFTARLVVAILGAALPLAALLFRTRLRDAETVAVALFLAANPVLLYYSRFMRVDLPVAAFMLFAVGFWVRAWDAEGRRQFPYFFAGVAAFAMAFTAKENAILYPVCWAAAALLVLDNHLFRAFAERGSSARDRLASYVDRVGRRNVAGLVALGVANPAVVLLATMLVGGYPPQYATAVVVLAAMTLAVVTLVVVADATPYHVLGTLAVVIVPLGVQFVPGKEEPGVYTLYWAFAGALMLDRALFGWFAGVDDDRRLVPEDLPERLRETFAGDWYRRVPPVAVGYVLFLAIFVFFYAPRGGGYPDPAGTANGAGLWIAIARFDPVMLANVFWEATYGTWIAFYGTWAAGGHQGHPYLPYLGDFLRTLLNGGIVLSILAGLGFLIDRYSGDGPRDLVAFCAYWGVFSVLGYPIVTDIAAPWTTIHAIVPLAIPAAVSAGLLYRIGLDSLTDDDLVSVGAAAVIGLLLVSAVGYAAVTSVYLNPQGPGNELVQYAQSSSTDVKPVLSDLREVSASNQGDDVVFYGSTWNSPNQSVHDVPHAGHGWFDRLPLAWYLESYQYEMATDGDPSTELVVNSTADADALRDVEAPVVITFADVDGGEAQNEADVREYLDGYSRWQGHRYQYGAKSAIAIYVDTSRLESPANVYDGRVGVDGRQGPRVVA